MASRLSHRLLVLAALGVLGTGTTACASRATAETHGDARAPVAIVIEAARPAGDAVLYRGPGAVVAAHTYRLAFEIAGRVRAVNVDVGDRVRTGDALAVLVADDYAAQVRAAE